MFYNSSDSFEYNNCVARGACSVSPTISSMQEIMFILLRQIAYYLLKLKNFGIEKEKVIYDIMSELAFIDTLKDLSEVQILNKFSIQYMNLVQVRKEYLKLCKENNSDCIDLKNIIKLSPKTSLSQILKRGDKEFLYKFKKLNFDKKYYAEILSGIIKSVCVNWVNVKEYDVESKYASDSVLGALNLFNASKIPEDKMKLYIDELAKFDIELLKQINKLQSERFGRVEEISVSTSTTPGKAILVSGSNFNDLKSVLDATVESDIDIYTNGNLLIAHAFARFNEYKNLKGHFGTGVNNSILDFATFPGAILLTKNESQNVEYLYRGRLFTTDKITPKGVVKLENNDYSALINSALQAKGFAKGQQRKPVLVGYNPINLQNEINKIIEFKPKKIFILGFSNLSINDKDYFKNLFSIMPEDYYAISFSYNPDMKNVLYINIGNNYALLYAALHEILQKIPIDSDDLVFFLTKCDVNSLSNIINLKNRGAKHIFLSDCPPLVINPAVLKSFTEVFDINRITTPKEDLAKLQ